MVRGDREEIDPCNQRSLGEDRKSEEGEPEAPPLRSRTCRSEEADMPSNNGGRKSGKISDKVGYGTRTFSTDPPLRKIFGGAALAGPPSRERGGPRRRTRRAAASPDTTVRGRTRGDPDAPPPPPGSPRRTRVWSRADPSGDGPREKDRAGRGPRVRGQCRGPRSTSLVRRSGSDRRRELSGDPRPSAERATRLDGRRGPPA